MGIAAAIHIPMLSDNINIAPLVLKGCNFHFVHYTKWQLQAFSAKVTIL